MKKINTWEETVDYFQLSKSFEAKNIKQILLCSVIGNKATHCNASLMRVTMCEVIIRILLVVEWVEREKTFEGLTDGIKCKLFL